MTFRAGDKGHRTEPWQSESWGMRKMGPGSCVVEGDFPSSPGAAEMSPLVYSEEIDQ